MGIQQKLHTKLVQKLILTPSLQQAIKLLPMSTLELSNLLNQEMVENPMLEEVPSEDLQASDAAAGITNSERKAVVDRAPRVIACPFRLLPLWRQAHVDRRGLAAANLHRRRERHVAVLADLDPVRTFRDLDDQALRALRPLPALAVDYDVGASRLRTAGRRNARPASNAR